MLDWLAQLLGLPRGCTGTSRTRPRRRPSPRSRRPARSGPAAPSTPRSTRTSRSRRRRGCSGSSSAPCRSTTSSGCCRSFPLADATAVVATVGHHLLDLGRSRGRARRPVRGGGRLAPRRRGLRRRGGGVSGAPLVPRRLRPRRLARRQPAQVAVHAHGLLGPLDAPPRGAARGVLGARRLPRSERRRARPARLRARARPALPRAQALDGAALLRPRRPAGADPASTSSSRRCFEGWVDDEPGWEVAAPRLLSTVCFRHRSPTTTSSRVRRPRPAASTLRRRASRAGA